ncbi:putative lipid scramblase CLPTM1 [Tachypleus tridentatus]|uniref:putative lipid scramblase CLPTM1 n=1 Tax=Tachypleus tridentatus TaxID=6853 RepID=UPI003FD4475A
MDMYIYVSEDENRPIFNDSEQLVWLEKGLVYGDWNGGSNGDGTSTHETTIVASSKLQNNGSLWLHVYIVKSGRSPDPSEKTHSRIYTVYKKKRLNKYKKLRYQRTHNLLTGETALDPELVKKSEKTLKR